MPASSGSILISSSAPATWSPGSAAIRYPVSFRGVLFVSLDVTTVGALPEGEQEWLRQILREEDVRHRGTEVIVAGGVELYLSGHHHAYYLCRPRSDMAAHGLVRRDLATP
ncbi:hypothetical protein [Ostreiculturibacter nitratireducens]|uniref:hypothetical protein n=1 Tax=Ostreiculturibacter nitratireducens TaxID=3075226 RepID=UPI0031B5B996